MVDELIVATITYSGTLVPDLITTSPWKCMGAQFGDRGSIPDRALFECEVLQPRNLDGARYRAGGAHFPQFNLLAIIPALDYVAANKMARELELIKGDIVQIEFVASSQTAYCVVLNSVAQPNAKRIINAPLQEGVVAGDDFIVASSAAQSSVDVMLTLQVIMQ